MLSEPFFPDVNEHHLPKSLDKHYLGYLVNRNQHPHSIKNTYISESLILCLISEIALIFFEHNTNIF